MGGSVAALAALVGVTERTVYRLRVEGLDDHRADLYAVRAGFHPALVWPEWQA